MNTQELKEDVIRMSESLEFYIEQFNKLIDHNENPFKC